MENVNGQQEGEKMGLVINVNKTKLTCVNVNNTRKIIIINLKIEIAEQCIYLGSIMRQDRDVNKDVVKRINTTRTSFISPTKQLTQHKQLTQK